MSNFKDPEQTANLTKIRVVFWAGLLVAWDQNRLGSVSTPMQPDQRVQSEQRLSVRKTEFTAA